MNTQRKIKFRCWDKEKKKMTSTLDLITFSGFLAGIEMKEPNYSDNFIFLQFTNLKDKNGKPIFEGDIVKTYYIPAWITKEEKQLAEKIGLKDKDKNIDGEIWEVEFIAGTFGLNQEKYTRFYHLGHFAEIQLEVIGNIYGNPELLKSSQPL